MLQHALETVKEIWRGADTRPLLIYIGVSFCYMLLEIGYGFSSNSLALISDGGHMLFDVLAQGTSVVAMVLSQRKATLDYSYGYGRHELMAVFANACFMLFISIFVLIEGLHRLCEPVHVEGRVMVEVAAVGLCINLAGIYFCQQWAAQGRTLGYRFGSGRLEPIGQGIGIWRSGASSGSGPGTSSGPGSAASALGSGVGSALGSINIGMDSGEHETARQANVRLLLLHIVVDVMSSLGVIVVACADTDKHRHIADPVVALLIAALIVHSVWPLAKRSGKVLLQCAPEEFRMVFDRLTREAALLDGVLECHHEHFWTHAPGIFVGSLCVRVRSDVDEQRVLSQVHGIFEQYIAHLTVQIEKDMPLDWLTDGTASDV